MSPFEGCARGVRCRVTVCATTVCEAHTLLVAPIAGGTCHANTLMHGKRCDLLQGAKSLMEGSHIIIHSTTQPQKRLYSAPSINAPTSAKLNCTAPPFAFSAKYAPSSGQAAVGESKWLCQWLDLQGSVFPLLLGLAVSRCRGLLQVIKYTKQSLTIGHGRSCYRKLVLIYGAASTNIR
jgi:hypothetical protein